MLQFIQVLFLQVKEKVLRLMDTDLLRQQMKWKEGLKEIRGIMTQVEQEGFTNLKTWRAHWDRQLYKALEHQYQVSDRVLYRVRMVKYKQLTAPVSIPLAWSTFLYSQI